MADFASRILGWFDRYGRRDLPWQGAGLYRVWVSEIMLQQTQVATVIPYYEHFVQHFPDLASLADAPLDDVLVYWSGLGYYARARNLHRAAQVVRDEYGGEFPRDFEAVRALPGIGPSTAGAILSQVFGERHAILDGNVKRVLTRHRAIAGWPGKAEIGAQLWAIAEQYTPVDRVADYTQAIMDVGATVCVRSRPRCGACPVSADCIAFAQGNPEAYPERKPAREKPRRATTMLLAVAGGAVYLERRPPAGIWGGLWSLPEIDGRADAWCEERIGASVLAIHTWPVLRHGFSHYDLDIEPVVAHVVRAAPAAVAESMDAVWYRLGDAPPGGIAAPVRRLLDTLRDSTDAANG